jgi:hypothetical protein
MLQQNTDPAFRGRVLSIFSLLFRSGPSAGAFVIGMAAPLLGLRPLVTVAAVGAAVLMFALSRRAAKAL